MGKYVKMRALTVKNVDIIERKNAFYRFKAKKGLVLLALIMGRIAFPAQSSVAETAVASHGLLKVSGNRIVDKNDESVSFAGNSFFWSNNGWGGERFYNSNVVSWLKHDWGTTIVRAALGVEGWGNYIDYPEDNKARIIRVVDAAIVEGLYVIIDWHTDHAENWPSQAVTFFQEMATTYGTNDNIIYEIYNEPLDISWPDVVKPYAESVIAAIRAIDPDNLIIVGTPEWSQRVDLPADNPITGYTNIAYTLHFYTGGHRQWLRDRATLALQKGIALFVTEWGSVGYTQTDPEADLWMQWCKENGISHCSWAVNTKEEAWSVLVTDASTNGNWPESSLTDWGIMARKIIKNWCQAGSPIPETIQAEYYDLGGEGVGYHDLDSENHGGQYRADGVDIETSTPGPYSVCWTEDGEWLRFTVNAAATYTNQVRYSVASADDKPFCLELTLDDVTVDTQTFRTTNGWFAWTNLYSSTPFVIDAGVHTVKVHFVSGGFNFDLMEFLSYTNPAPGSPIPAAIQAEDYDLGGEGTGYHDVDSENHGGQYRTDGVDIESSTPGLYNLGWIEDGEWLRFTVFAATTYTNQVRYSVASQQDRQFCLRMTLDDETVDAQTFQTTDGWWAWTNLYSSTPFVIDAGVHTVKVHFVRGGFNFDLMEFLAYTNEVPAYRNPAAAVSNRVNDLLSRMTLDEKIGQMCQVNFPLLSKTGSNESDIRDYGLGSLLSGGGDCPVTTNSVKVNTAEAWADMIDRFQGFAMATRLGIPMLYGVDAVHGHNNLYGATIFPHNIGLGAMHNPDLVRRAAQVTAVEVAATGVRWTFAPCVAVPRSEYWGRFYEGFGETAELAAGNGAAAIEGFQGSDLASPTNILACAKHFAGDGGTAWGTGRDGGMDRGNTVLDETAFRSLHLEPYRAAVTAGVMSIMISYSSWNGLKMHVNTNMLTGVLKGELGFQGFLVSDWGGIDEITPGNYTNCVIASINAGLDMIMVPGEYENFLRILKQSVTNSLISMSRIDDAVRRILNVKFRLGLFERPYADRSLLSRVGSAEHRAVACEAVRQSCVVLKNEDGVLPLRKGIQRIHVAGKNADDLGSQCGGWTISWQGGTGGITIGTTILEAIRNTVCPTTVVTFSESGAGAAGADVGIVVVGEAPYAEYYGDTQDLNLSSTDAAVIQNVKTQGVPVVTVLVSGRPLVIQPQLSNMNACVVAWLPGTEGQGVADVLFGDYYPHGSLPHSWPRQEPVNIGDASYDPLYPLAGAECVDPCMAALREDGALSFVWPYNHEGFVLQSSTSLVGNVVWTDVPGVPVDTGDTHRISIGMPPENEVYYRLRRP